MERIPPQGEQPPPADLSPKDWLTLGEMVDYGQNDLPGTYLTRVAERLRFGLPPTRTSIEMAASAAETSAQLRLGKGLSPALTPEEICSRIEALKPWHNWEQLGPDLDDHNHKQE